MQVWKSRDGKCSLVYRGHRAQVNAVAWSPDATRITSGGDDKVAQIWDACSGQPVLVYRGHATGLYNFVECVVWSPDGTRVASCNDDRQVHLWYVILPMSKS